MRDLFEADRQKSEKTTMDCYFKSGDMERIKLEEDKEKRIANRVLQQKETMNRLREAVSQNPGISKDSLLEKGFTDLDLKVLKKMKSVVYRKTGYFLQ